MSNTYDAVIRVSRRNGRGEDGEEWSPDRQRQAILDAAQRHGFSIANWYSEEDSVSGGTTDREGLNTAVDRAVKGETDGVAVAKLDRFARTVVGGFSTIAKLEDADRHLFSAREGMLVGPETNATDKLLRGIMLQIAAWQRDSMTEEWESIRASHIRRGIASQTPYGYRKDERRRLVEHPEEAAIVRRMFAERAAGGDGGGWVAIADGLNRDGISTGETNGNRRRAQGWSHTRVKSMVENRVYLGEISSGEFVNRDAHPGIVSEELFNAANGRRETTGRKAGRDYLLTGLIYCAGCGVRMVGNSTVLRDVTYTTYRCRRNHPFGKCEAPASIPGAAIEAFVMEWFRERFFGETLDGVDDTSGLEAATHALEEALAIIRAYPSANRRQMIEDPDGYAAAMEEIGDEVVTARETLQRERNRLLKVEFPADLESLWPNLPTARKRGYLAQAIDLVAVARVERASNPPVESRARLFARGRAPGGIVGRALTGPVPITL